MSDSADTRPDPAGRSLRSQPVSFTRRGGRLNPRQQKAWDLLAEQVRARAGLPAVAASAVGG